MVTSMSEPNTALDTDIAIIGAGLAGAMAATVLGRAGYRVTLVEGWSTKVELPERADVMISEIMGDEPFGEHVLEATADAVKRLLEPRARMIPRRVRLFAVPVAIPARALGEHLFTRTALRRWRSWYGFDFAPLEKISREGMPALSDAERKFLKRVSGKYQNSRKD